MAHTKLTAAVLQPPSPTADQVMGTNSFDSIEIDVGVENPATQTRAKEGDPVELCEISQEQIVLQIPRRLCAVGHHLVLELRTTIPGEKGVFKMKLTAKVEALEYVDDGLDRVTLVPKQYEEKEFARLLGLFSARQQAIMDFLTAARGY